MSTQFQSRTTSLSDSIDRVHSAERLVRSLFLLQVVQEFASINASSIGPRVSVDEARRQVSEQYLERPTLPAKQAPAQGPAQLA